MAGKGYKKKPTVCAVGFKILMRNWIEILDSGFLVKFYLIENFD